MITLLRKIRQRLLTENRFSKYLIYAVGEIVLVVIGIVIALQLNISYTNKESKKTIKQYLYQLNKEINQNNRVVSFNLKNVNEDMKESNEYLKILNTKNPNEIQDSTVLKIIGRLGPTNWFPLANSVFEDFSASGLINEIKNDTLKRAIILIKTRINQYDYAKEELIESWNRQLLPYYTKYANLMPVFDSIRSEKIPPNYLSINRKAFINNREFNNIIMNRMILSKRSLNQLERVQERFEELQKDIDQYLQTYD